MDIFNEVCRDIPEHYLLNVMLENGAACIEIRDPKGKTIDWHLDDLSFEDQLKRAVKWCVEDSKSNYRPPRYDAVYHKSINGNWV